MLSNGVIIKKNTPLTPEQENDIYSEIQYVCGFDRCEKIKALFAKELAGKEAEYEKKWNENEYNADKKYPGMNSWEIVGEVTMAIDISYRYGLSHDEDNNNKYISINLREGYDDAAIMPLDVSGYETLVRIYRISPSPTPALYATVDPDTEILTLHSAGAPDITASLKPLNDTLRTRYADATNS